MSDEIDEPRTGDVLRRELRGIADVEDRQCWDREGAERPTPA